MIFSNNYQNQVKRQDFEGKNSNNVQVVCSRLILESKIKTNV